MAVTYSLARYRDQFRRRSPNSTAPSPMVEPAAPTPAARRVGPIPDGQRCRRFDRPDAAGAILGDGLDQLHDDIEQYVKVFPLNAHDTGNGDVERFLSWLSRRAERTDEQCDEAPCRRGRQTVEFVAVKKRLAHVRFQELLALNEQRLPNVDVNSRVSVHLNPIHVWSTSVAGTAANDADSAPRAVLFFPVGDDIRTAEIDADCADVIRYLERREPITVKDLCKLCLPAERTDLLRMLGDLARTGMIALS